MAAGFARASGRVGVALVTSGPGATNMVTPVRDSMADMGVGAMRYGLVLIGNEQVLRPHPRGNAEWIPPSCSHYTLANIGAPVFRPL